VATPRIGTNRASRQATTAKRRRMRALLPCDARYPCFTLRTLPSRRMNNTNDSGWLCARSRLRPFFSLDAIKVQRCPPAPQGATEDPLPIQLRRGERRSIQQILRDKQRQPELRRRRSMRCIPHSGKIGLAAFTEPGGRPDRCCRSRRRKRGHPAPSDLSRTCSRGRHIRRRGRAGSS
jgi:hypothetical protein